MADSALPIMLFLGFLFVSLTLILGLGIMSREEERAREAVEDGVRPAGVAEAAGAPLLLAAPASNRMQAYVGSSAAETTGVAGEAASSPSPATVDHLVEQLEEFLRGEARAVAAFVAAPSIGGLNGETSRAPRLRRFRDLADGPHEQ